MMSIKYVKPDLSPMDTARSKRLVDTMAQLMQRVSKIAKPFATIPLDARAGLLAEGVPSILVDNLVLLTERIREEACPAPYEHDEVQVGFTNAAIDLQLFASPTIIKSLKTTHADRCAWCETALQPGERGVVSHFRPPTGYMGAGTISIIRPGYTSLAYEPENLFASCEICASVYKRDQFPVLGTRNTTAPIRCKEQADLVNPYVEEPRDYIRFNPASAAAYPWDLVSRYYSDTRDWSPRKTTSEIWADPSLIPHQHDHAGNSLNSTVDGEFDRWASSQCRPLPTSGATTIRVFGLNRPALLRGRAAHMRQLRGLWETEQSGSTGERQDATALLDELLTGSAAAAIASRQYLSSSIDAIGTWNAHAPAPSPSWIGVYNAIIAAFLPSSELVQPPPFDGDLMYFVLGEQLGLTDRRRLVSLSRYDQVFGVHGGASGIFLSLDWSRDLDRIVHVTDAGKKVIEETTVRALVARGSQSLLRVFSRYQVWVMGHFAPLAKHPQPPVLEAC